MRKAEVRGDDLGLSSDEVLEQAEVLSADGGA
jgi:hypothetical protein